jgi:hypothetical protein
MVTVTCGASKASEFWTTMNWPVASASRRIWSATS